MKKATWVEAIASALIVALIFITAKDARLIKNKTASQYLEKTEPIVVEELERIEIKSVDGTFKPYKLTYLEMELVYLGKYFITAYCPSECGYNGSNYPVGWMTASDTICHRADYEYRLSEPTTCAVSRSMHSFGEEFYIPAFDRTFVAEDTGPGVQGHHLDLFYEEYDDVVSFPTGYYDVYAVEWVEVEVVVNEQDHKNLELIPPLEYYRERAEG